MELFIFIILVMSVLTVILTDLISTAIQKKLDRRKAMSRRKVIMIKRTEKQPCEKVLHGERAC